MDPAERNPVEGFGERDRAAAAAIRQRAVLVRLPLRVRVANQIDRRFSQKDSVRFRKRIGK